MSRTKLYDTLILILALLVMTGIYISHYLLTYFHISFTPLPLDFSTDIYLYLNYTLLKPDSGGMVLNPWYHVMVPAAQLIYLKFGLLNIFTWLNHLLNDNMALTLILWNTLWSVLTFGCAFLFLRSITEIKNIWILLFGISLIFFFQPSSLPSEIRGWLHFPGIDYFASSQLPLMRTFFPQLAIPFLLLYLFFLIRAFSRNRPLDWIALFFIQFIAFINFPYNTVLMGITTFILLLSLIASKISIPWKQVLLFGAAVIIADLLFLKSGSMTTTVSGHSPLELDLSMIKKVLNSTPLVLFVFSILTALLPEKNRIVKLTLTALGFGLFILLFSDIIIHPRQQLTHHFLYFILTVIAILLFYVTVKIVHIFIKSKRVSNLIFIACTIFLTMTGAMKAYAQMQTSLPLQMRNQTAYQLLNSLNPSPNDLLIAPAVNVNDIATWLPLVFKSEVLFARNSEFLLPFTPEGEEVYWKHEASYLYLQGIDSTKLHKILFKEGKEADIKRIIMVGQRFDLYTSSRREMLQEVYKKLSYWLIRLENDPQYRNNYFKKYDRIIVVDDATHPMFRLPSALEEQKVLNGNGLVTIKVYTPPR